MARYDVKIDFMLKMVIRAMWFEFCKLSTTWWRAVAVGTKFRWSEKSEFTFSGLINRRRQLDSQSLSASLKNRLNPRRILLSPSLFLSLSLSMWHGFGGRYVDSEIPPAPLRSRRCQLPETFAGDRREDSAGKTWTSNSSSLRRSQRERSSGPTQFWLMGRVLQRSWFPVRLVWLGKWAGIRAWARWAAEKEIVQRYQRRYSFLFSSLNSSGTRVELSQINGVERHYRLTLCIYLQSSILSQHKWLYI